jgi:hypothetical protein
MTGLAITESAWRHDSPVRTSAQLAAGRRLDRDRATRPVRYAGRARIETGLPNLSQV